jgi:hypothetical protein
VIAMIGVMVVAAAAAAGAALRGRLTRRRPVTGRPLVALNCVAALLLGGLYAQAPVVGPVAVAAGTGFLAAWSPLTALVRTAPTGGAPGEVLRDVSRLGVAVLGHLIYAAAFAVVGFVAMFAIVKGRGY